MGDLPIRELTAVELMHLYEGAIDGLADLAWDATGTLHDDQTLSKTWFEQHAEALRRVNDIAAQIEQRREREA